ncbi:ATP-binding cassette domain-containing protein [Catellatospora sp. NPDC049133]|uniref:ATP-binding cassette domain-containing protein n=1 Tax=Catellatospora sp. NPDC049133 TaxID=3155499 RepID=UPI0033CDCDED
MSTPLLRIRGLRVRLGTAQILHDVDLDIAQGSRHALVGHNGAGKSTLLHAIAGTVRPRAGSIMLAGRDITNLAPHRRARLGIGRTWQHPALCGSLTALQNVTLAMPGHDPSRAHRALMASGLGAHIDTAADQMSYGLRRRLELVVALAAQPRLLLLDEPSAGLSPAEINSLIMQLTSLPPDTSVVLVDHDLDVVSAIAHQVTVLHHGRILATGAAEEVRRAPLPHQARPRTVTPVFAPPPAQDRPVVLDVDRLTTGYHGAPVLAGTSLHVTAGEIVAIAGGNGTGKSTLLNAIAGLQPVQAPTTIRVGGREVHGLDAAGRARLGIALVPQDRRLFAQLSVAENLVVPRPGGSGPLGDPAALFPALAGRLRQRAGTLSGGEQQMLSIARALTTTPRVLLLDEPFEGLAQSVAEQLWLAITELARGGMAIVITGHRTDQMAELGARVLVLTGRGLSGPAPARGEQRRSSGPYQRPYR